MKAVMQEPSIQEYHTEHKRDGGMRNIGIDLKKIWDVIGQGE